jgi:hypothetical protein
MVPGWVHFQNYVQHTHFLLTLDVKLKTRWAITGSWEPLVLFSIQVSCFVLTHPTQMVTCYIAVIYRPLSYAPSSVSVCNTLFWKKTGPLEPNFIGNFQLMVRCLPNLCWFFLIGNAQQKHETLIKGCLLFLCMQHLLFNWCWWFYLSVHFKQSSLCSIQQSLYGFYSS